MRIKTNCLVAVLLGLFALPVSVHAGQASASTQATSNTPLKLTWDFRARHEQVDSGVLSDDARADTARLRLGLEAAFDGGWSAFIEGAGVASTGKHYNSGSNGQTQYPVILDPRSSELNRAWLEWQRGGVAVRAGRQRLLLDNQRWVGNVGWRQHEQTFDGVKLDWQPATNWTLSWAWLDRVQRVAGRDALTPLARKRDLDSHLFHATRQYGNQQWAAYAYLHEDRDVALASSATWGLRWQRKPAKGEDGPGWQLEAARQSDYANSPLRFRHSYWLLQPAWTVSGFTARAGWEHLGGNGQHALQTPLATLHAFNGWADQFGTIPANGLEDYHTILSGGFGHGALSSRLGWTVARHDFRADTGSARYGREWDAALSMQLATNLTGLIKVARYHADSFARDTDKLWLQIEWRDEHSFGTGARQ